MLTGLMACKSAQTELPLLQNCPGSGDCEVQVFKETKLFIEEGSSGISEVSFDEDSDFQVIFIQYKESGKSKYMEEIYLQVPSRFREIHSKNHSLQNQKVVFGKIKKGEEVVFERITKGVLQLINLKDFTSLRLEIKSEEPQVLKSIEIKI